MEQNYRGRVVCVVDSQNVYGITLHGLPLNAFKKTTCLANHVYYVGSITEDDESSDGDMYISLYTDPPNSKRYYDMHEIYMGYFHIEDFITLAEYRDMQINSILD